MFSATATELRHKIRPRQNSIEPASMPVSLSDQPVDSTPESAVEPPVKLSAYQRRVAALKARRPGSLPVQYLGKVLKPHVRITAMAEVGYGQTAADALEALIRPDSKIDRGIARRALEMMFPKDRPLVLNLPDAKSPEAFNQATRLIHEAWSSGKISPQEARTCQELVERRYKAWLKYQAGKGLG
jgi:hypothetical protein